MKLTSKKKRLIRYLAFLILISILVYWLGRSVTSEDILNIVKQAGFWAPLVYIILFALTHIIAPLSGTPIYFAGYAFFANKVQIYTYLATMLSATVNFLIARQWGRRLIGKLVGKKDMSQIDQFIEDYGVRTLIFLRIFQGHLVDFISYASGLTNMKFVPYITITVLAPIPWLLLWQFYIFPRVEDIGDFTIWHVATLIPLFIISWLYIRYKSRRKKTDAKKQRF